MTAGAVVQPPPEAPSIAARSTAVVGRIARACGVLAALAIVAILVIVCVETVLRQFQASLLVTDEIAGYLNAAAIFLGLAWTLREGGFIRVELLYDRAVGRLKQALRWLIVLTATAFTAIMLWVCMRHVDLRLRSRHPRRVDHRHARMDPPVGDGARAGGPAAPARGLDRRPRPRTFPER